MGSGKRQLCTGYASLKQTDLWPRNNRVLAKYRLHTHSQSYDGLLYTRYFTAYFTPQLNSYTNRHLNFVYRHADIWLGTLSYILHAQLFLKPPLEYSKYFMCKLYIYIYIHAYGHTSYILHNYIQYTYLTYSPVTTTTTTTTNTYYYHNHHNHYYYHNH